jgi:lysozyme family protein
MMSRVLPEIGASHYTLLAAIEVLGKSPGALLSGVIAQHGGYPATFALATLLSAGTLLLLWHGQGPGASRAAPLV